MRRYNYEEEYNQLALSNDFMFAKVMKNKELCKKLLEIILDVEIERVEYVDDQKVIDIMREAHGVRLDIYVKDGNNTVYNVEMQTTNTKNLPKRSRYYQGVIDLNLLNKSENYRVLNKSYIIFICMFDIFGKGRHIYTFENYCRQDKELSLGDEAIKVFLNPYSDMDDVDEELGNFLRYLSDRTPVDKFTAQLEEEVTRVKENKEWRREFMTLSMKFQEKLEEGFEKGVEQGIEQGIEQGKLLTLYALVRDNIITVKKASEMANMTEDEFLAAMNKTEF